MFTARDKRRLRSVSIWSGVALTLALIAGSTSPADFPNAVGRAPVNLSEQLAAISADPTKPTSINLIADRSAQQTFAFKTVASSLTHISGDLYQGKITKVQARILANIPGLTFSADLAADALPIQDAKPDFVIPKLYWDAGVTINETDSELKPTRTRLGIDGSGILVAVLDTGVDSEALGLGDGKVVHREDFSTAPADGSCSDDGKLDPYGHGTHVSSIIAGAVDQRDAAIEGLAPGAKLVDLRVLNCAGSGEMGDVNRALQWILDNRQTYPIDVVNMSLGTRDGQKDGLDTTSILINRLVANGIFVAVAAGNGGAASENLFSPATAEFATTVAAATVNKYGKFLSQFSSHGPTSDGRPGIDITAPGAGIRAALTTKRASINNYEITMAGTSMASPYVAGLAALMLNQHPEWKPTGQVCELGADCPAGVDKSQMSNQVQSHMKTSDWFESGIDPHSGAGMVSASASLNQTEMPAAKVFRGATDVASDNIVRFAPSNVGQSISILLDSTWLTDMWDNSARFGISFRNENYDQVETKAVCTLLSDTSCLFGEMSFAPKLYTYYIAPSQAPTFMIIRTNKAVNYTANIDGYSGAVDLFSGVATTNLDLIASASGSITLTRTVESDSPTVFSVAATGGLAADLSVTLPAGPAGTAASLAVAAPDTAHNSLERVVFTTTDGFSIASSVRLKNDGNGPLIFPNELGYDDSGSATMPFMAEDGSLLGDSVASGMRNPSGYANPYRVRAQTRLVERYDIAQTSYAQIDVLGISQDGSTGLFRQYPAGAGIVPGDDDMFYTYFVRNLDGNQSYKIGPDQARWPNWYSSPTPSIAIDSDGLAVAWAITYPDGTNPTVLAVDHGDGFATNTVLDTFDSQTQVRIFGMTNHRVLVRVLAPGLDEFRVYEMDATYMTVFNQPSTAVVATFSQDGSAVGILDNNVDRPYCWRDGTLNAFTAPTQLGSSYPGQVVVANDCSWFMTTWETHHVEGASRGAGGIQLIRISSDGTISKLDSFPDTSGGWLSNKSGTIFLRATGKALEPGDLNGDVDIYRGLGASVETPVKLKINPTLVWPLNYPSLSFGESVTFVAYSSSTSPVTYSVDSGPCTLDGATLTARSGSGYCLVSAKVAGTDDYLGKSMTLSITLNKVLRPDAWMTIQVPDALSAGTLTTFTVSTKTPGDYTLSVEGPCSLVNGKLLANSTGDCKISAYSDENENYRGYLTYRWVHVGKAAWSASEFNISAPSSAVANTGFGLSLTNTTGLNADLRVEGGCNLDGTNVTMLNDGADCTIRYSLPATESHDWIEISRVVHSESPTLVLSKVLTLGWLPSLKLPQGQFLDFNASAKIISGACLAAGARVTAEGFSGSCIVEVGGYQSGTSSYSKETLTINLGAAKQVWAKALPTFSTKKLTLSKYTFITNGQPMTNYGNAGSWKISTGCKIVKSGLKVTVDMGKMKKCVATVSAPAGFKTAPLSKTWTFTR